MQINQFPKVGLTDTELSFELKLLETLQPQTIVEIGSADGGHISFISNILKKKKYKMISIDPWSTSERYKEYCQNLRLLQRTHKNINYSMIKGESQSSSTRLELERILKRESLGIDFLFIDGAHDEASVLADWNNYQRFVTGFGVTCFHDIVAYEDVASAWSKIIQNLGPNYLTKTFEEKGMFLLDGAKNVRLGLGYIYRNSLEGEARKLLDQL